MFLFLAVNAFYSHGHTEFVVIKKKSSAVSDS